MLSIAPKGPPAPDPIAPPAANDAQAGRSSENRTAARRLASAIPEITGLRISPHGVEATLVNISETGLLAECGERLKPGSAVTVVFEGTFQPRTMEGRVARNSVSSMGSDGRLRYHVGISFARAIELPPEEPAPIVEAPAPPPAVAAPEPVEPVLAIPVEPAAPEFAPPSAPAPAAQAEPEEIVVPIVFPQAVRNRW
jgi:hypothetical protein